MAYIVPTSIAYPPTGDQKGTTLRLANIPAIAYPNWVAPPDSLPDTGPPIPPVTIGQIWPRGNRTISTGGDVAQRTRSAVVITTSTTAGVDPNTDYLYLCNAALTLTLPTAVGNSNIYSVKRTGTGSVTVATSAGQTIDGVATVAIGVQWQSIDLMSDGTNWVVI